MKPTGTRILQTLLVLVTISVPAPAYAGSAYLKVCNTGRAPFDVFVAYKLEALSITWLVESWHLDAGGCERVYSTTNTDAYPGAEAHIGFAFDDSGGQWIAGRARQVPDLGSYADPNWLVAVTNGNRGYKALTTSDKRFCIKPGKTQYRSAAEAGTCAGFRLGSNDRGGYRSLAAAFTFTPRVSSCYNPGVLTCSGGDYSLDVAVAPGSGEIVADSGHDGGTSSKTTDDATIDWAKQLVDVLKNADEYARRAKAQQEADYARRYQADVERDKAATRHVADFAPNWLGQGLIVKGTVSRVELQRAFAVLHFQESPNFVVCFDRQMFAGFGGKDFSDLVGKTVDVRGRVDRPPCAPNSPGMVLTVPAQIRVN